MAEKFTPAQLADPAISGDLANPANDGIPNLIKYALALEPMVCGVDKMPYSGEQDGYLTLTFRRNKSATDLTFEVQCGNSVDGGSWSPATAVLSEVDQGDWWLVTVQDEVPISESPSRFMRLKVSR